MFMNNRKVVHGGKPVKQGFEYSSGENIEWLTIDELKRKVASLYKYS